jgi:transcriptional regulator with XRE-family HTH domain
MNREPSTGPTLRLDGAAIRRIREAKALTQLYVAEVVGVTVDTVSRWENNRTSAVKRDNAEALAGALEIGLGEILRKAEPEFEPALPDAGPERPRARRLRPWFLGAAVLLLAAGLWAWRACGVPVVEVEPVRQLPAYAPPGSTVPVLVHVRASRGGGRRVVVREKLPPGWQIERSTLEPDSGPGPDGLVRWILPLSEGEAQIGYLVRAPATVKTGTSYRFRGEVVLPGKEGEGVEVGGEQRIDLEWVHWADDNGDFHLSDSELLDALERLELVRDLELDSSDLRRLWGAGAYLWDEDKKSFEAARP